MYTMLQQDVPGDYVVATGQTHTVREFVEIAFSVAGLDYSDYLQINQDYFRPSESITLCGDASRARRALNWAPTKTFEEIVSEMVLADIELFRSKK
jgi:GDPmannose 4,6-dehydratase